MTKPTTPQLAALEQLIDAISPTREIAREHKAQLDALSHEGTDDEEDFGPLWLLKDVIDGETGFFVDWKDTESFVETVMEIAEAWGAAVTFGVEDPLDADFLEGSTVVDLMVRANAELSPKGFTLWNWATNGDCYAGWITRTEAASTVTACAKTLETQIRPGSEPF